jgi:hypothetical protein
MFHWVMRLSQARSKRHASRSDGRADAAERLGGAAAKRVGEGRGGVWCANRAPIAIATSQRTESERRVGVTNCSCSFWAPIEVY